MSIRQHVNYSGKPTTRPWPVTSPKPIVKTVAPVTSARAARLQRIAQSADETLLAFIEGVAKRGERCPSGIELTRLLGPGSNRRLIALARAGRIAIEVGGKNWRVVRIGKRQTMGLPCRRVPYLRIDGTGTWRRRGGVWERVA